MVLLMTNSLDYFVILLNETWMKPELTFKYTIPGYTMITENQ